MLIHLIGDYGHGDLAFAEVTQALIAQVPGASVTGTPVPPFDTVGAGFCVAQLALSDGPAERLVFHNVAPRRDETDPRPGNEGERLAAARARDVWVVGPNAGHVFSFLRDEVDAVRFVDVPAGGSQFRSRDVFPAAVGRLAAGDESLLGEELPAELVPAMPEGVVAYVDGYGNLKTTWTERPGGLEGRVIVTIGGIAAAAHIGEGTFEVPEGELSLAPGSSGWRSRSGADLRFHELLLRGASAAERFGYPRPGTPVEVEPSGSG